MEIVFNNLNININFIQTPVIQYGKLKYTSYLKRNFTPERDPSYLEFRVGSLDSPI